MEGELKIKTLDGFEPSSRAYYDFTKRIRTLAQFDAAITAAKTGDWVILSDITLDADKTIPEGVTLHQRNGAKITLGTYNLTLTKTNLADADKLSQFFVYNSTGVVNGSCLNTELYPEIWGCSPLGFNDANYTIANDCTLAIQSAVDFVNNDFLNLCDIKFRNLKYYAHEIDLSAGFRFNIIGSGQTRIWYNGTGGTDSHVFKLPTGINAGGMRQFQIQGISENNGATPAWWGIWGENTEVDWGVNFNYLFISYTQKAHIKVSSFVNMHLSNIRFGPTNEWCLSTGLGRSFSLSDFTVDMSTEYDLTAYGIAYRNYLFSLNGESKIGYGLIEFTGDSKFNGNICNARIEGLNELREYNGGKGLVTFDASTFANNILSHLSINNIEGGADGVKIARVINGGWPGITINGYSNDAIGSVIDLGNDGLTDGDYLFSTVHDNYPIIIISPSRHRITGNAYPNGLGVNLDGVNIKNQARLLPNNSNQKYGDIIFTKNAITVQDWNEGNVGWVCTYPKLGFGIFDVSVESGWIDEPTVLPSPQSVSSGDNTITLSFDAYIGMSLTIKYSDGSYQSLVIIDLSGSVATLHDIILQTDTNVYIYQSRCYFEPFGKTNPDYFKGDILGNSNKMGLTDIGLLNVTGDDIVLKSGLASELPLIDLFRSDDLGYRFYATDEEKNYFLKAKGNEATIRYFFDISSAVAGNITLTHNGTDFTIYIPDSALVSISTFLDYLTSLVYGDFRPGIVNSGTGFINFKYKDYTAFTPTGGFTDVDTGITITQAVIGTLGINNIFQAEKLTTSEALDFGSIAANSQSDLTITLTGVTAADYTVQANPIAALESGLSYYAFISATNTVTIRMSNLTASSIDPASVTFNVVAIKI